VTEYVGQAFVLDADGDETEVRASYQRTCYITPGTISDERSCVASTGEIRRRRIGPGPVTGRDMVAGGSVDYAERGVLCLWEGFGGTEVYGVFPLRVLVGAGRGIIGEEVTACAAAGEVTALKSL
jgi:hypothetical protein